MGLLTAASLGPWTGVAAAQPEPTPDPPAQPAPPEPAPPELAPPEPAPPRQEAAPPPVEVTKPAAPPAAEARAQVEAPAAAPPAAPPTTAPPAAAPMLDSFTFGSYGRVIAATDFRGRPGRDADIVAHGSRLDESNYVELELRRNDSWEKTHSSTLVVATLAMAHPIFHYTGEFDAKIALRNLFLEVRDIGVKGLSAWAGSRMYRGDDIYLLDYWPLDNLNTLGAGVRYDMSPRTRGALHAGFLKPQSGFFGQEVDRPAPLEQIGVSKVEVLSRQKFIGSAKLSHTVPLGEKAGLKGVAYGELHQLPSGQRESKPGDFDTLPSDGGYVLGAQIGAFTGERTTHVNLFFRYAHGIAAYGDFSTPTQLAPDRTTAGAHELVVALGGNWESGPVGVMLGAYARSFRNSSEDLDFNDVDEGILLARPHVFFTELYGLAVEASYQTQQRGVLSSTLDAGGTPGTPEGPHSASLGRFGIIPFLSPAGRGDYSRPHLRLIYALTLRDEGARALYPQDDVASLRKVEHFFGFGAEWWFNSPNYGG